MAPAGLDGRFYAELDARLGPSDERLLAEYPGEKGRRQPVHTVYVPANQYAADTAPMWGAQALAMLDEHAPDADMLADLLGVGAELAGEVRPLVAAKLAREPIEDLRMDFEDGYGQHPDAEEDADVERAAGSLVESVRAGTAPPFVGLRFKSLEPATRRRGLRSLDLFIGRLLSAVELPAGFVVTLPKVTHVEQVEAFVDVCAALERAHGLPERRLSFEIQIETPQAVQSATGGALSPDEVTERTGVGRDVMDGLYRRRVG